MATGLFPGRGGGKPARALPRWVQRGNVFVKMRPRDAGLPQVCEARRVGWSLPFLSFYLFILFFFIRFAIFERPTQINRVRPERHIDPGSLTCT